MAFTIDKALTKREYIKCPKGEPTEKVAATNVCF